jgi:acid phosphatase (class A)
MFGPFAASAAEDGGWLKPVVADRLLPPPPTPGSRLEQDEIAEIHRLQARAMPAETALAKHDNDVEDPSIFADAIGLQWDLARLPRTKFLMQKVMEVDRVNSGPPKRFFSRPRPWLADPNIQTCADHGIGPARNSYPSGHAMLGYELGVVLASLIPEKAQAILARADLYGENRILCGFHFRSDITAGQQYGTALAVEMLEHPRFHAWFLEARSELIAAGITH